MRTAPSFWTRLRGNPAAFTGFVICVVVTVAALSAPWLSTHSPFDQVIRERFQAPTAGHLLGTDHFGRDTFSRVLFGFRSSIGIAFSAVGIAALFGTILGLLAAYHGGWTDRVIMRIMDILLAFPIILLAIGILAVLGPGSFNVALAIGIVYLPIFARMARGPSLTILSWDYVSAARALGAPGSRVLLQHVLPNIAAPMLVQLTLSLSTAILVEASLSFLGLGTQPPTPSLGLMLADSRDTMLLSPWPSVFSGLAILLVSFGFNLFGDGLRDLLDPSLRS